MVENLSKRTEYGKSYDLEDRLERVTVSNEPMHYFSPLGQGPNPNESGWEDIEVKLNLLMSSKEYSSHYLSDKHKLSYGFRNDKRLDKFYGIRKGTTNQLEGSLKSIVINGDTINIPDKFISINTISSSEIEHILTDNISIYSRIGSQGFVSALKTSEWVEDFCITERLDLKGFNILNEYILDYGVKTYTPDLNNAYNIQTGDGEIITIQAKMWNSISECNNGINHSLVEREGELLYTKQPNEIGQRWLLINNPTFYIDVSVYYTTWLYRESTSADWATARAGTGTTGSGSDSTVYCDAIGKGSYCVRQAYLNFNLSSYTNYNYVLNAASLYLYALYNNNAVSINAYKASNNAWSTNTTDYVAQVAIDSTSATWHSGSIANLNLVPLGTTTYYRLREVAHDVGNSAPETDQTYSSSITNAYLSLTLLNAVKNPLMFGFNF